MIEEAAGTRLYESKKESAQRTIEKKDMKLQEIDRVSGNRANIPRNYFCFLRS
jgi:structural maintenance of chromosome 2